MGVVGCCYSPNFLLNFWFKMGHFSKVFVFRQRGEWASLSPPPLNTPLGFADDVVFPVAA